jgi:hypothetical protein
MNGNGTVIQDTVQNNDYNSESSARYLNLLKHERRKQIYNMDHFYA